MEYDGLQASGNHWQKWSRPEIHQSTWTVLKLAYTTGETFDILWVQTSLHDIIEFKQFLPSIHFESRKGCLYPDKIFGVHWASPPSEPERLHNSDWLGASWHQKYDWVPNLRISPPQKSWTLRNFPASHLHRLRRTKHIATASLRSAAAVTV